MALPVNIDYDFFIAHAGEDVDNAKKLYDLLIEDYNVFLDKNSLQAGDNWVVALPEALKKSKIIILLLSRNSKKAHYLQEEIARAIELQKNNKDLYKIIPIYMDGFPSDISEIPYGLYQIHSLDFIVEGSYENVCLKLTKYLNLLPENKEESFKIKDKLAFKHILHEYPVGPMVDGSLVPIGLIEAFAEFVDISESLQVIDEANAFRKQADPNENGAITIKKINLPHPSRNSPKEFWLQAFAQARLHGPRMLAALLLSVQDTFFPPEVINAKNKLLNGIKNNPHKLNFSQ
jgi:hypothetical protein